jgi:hypothetical protein
MNGTKMCLTKRRLQSGRFALSVGSVFFVLSLNRKNFFTFIGIWFMAAAVNMWIGVSQVGYSFKEELPIFLLIFLLPAAVAAVVKWKFL